jgi:ATP-dependent RNA helicase DDX3X
VQQIFDEARKFCYETGLFCAVAYGGGENIRDQLRAVENGADIIVAAPGRLVDFMERGKVNLREVLFLTLDEADRMLDMGFEPQIRRIVEGADMPPSESRQTLLFSATFPREVQRLAQDFLKRDFVTLTVGRVGAATDTIVQKVTIAPAHDRTAPHRAAALPLCLSCLFVVKPMICIYDVLEVLMCALRQQHIMRLCLLMLHV